MHKTAKTDKVWIPPEEGQGLMQAAMTELNLSTRTIAGMLESEDI